jgi:muconolactone delta-isomerase
MSETVPTDRTKEDVMQYLVQLRLKAGASPNSPEEGTTFIEQFMYPTLEMAKKLQEEKKILAGGPVSGAVALALVVSADSAQELDNIVAGLPIWPLMDTEVTPLSTFDARKQTLLPRLQRLKGQAPSSEGRGKGDK